MLLHGSKVAVEVDEQEPQRVIMDRIRMHENI